MGLRGPAAKPKPEPEKPALLSEVPPPVMPMGKEATEHYRRIGRTLIDAGLLTSRDIDMLTQAAIAMADCIKFQRTLDVEGDTFEGSHGIRQHPAHALLSSARKHYLCCLDRLGMSPERRQRVKPSQPPPPDDGAPVDPYFGGKVRK